MAIQGLKQESDGFVQMPTRLAGKERSFPALDDALQLAQRSPSADKHNTQDEDSLLRSQWSLQAVPGLAAKTQHFDLLRRWLSVSLEMPPITWCCAKIMQLVRNNTWEVGLVHRGDVPIKRVKDLADFIVMQLSRPVKGCQRPCFIDRRWSWLAMRGSSAGRALISHRQRRCCWLRSRLTPSTAKPSRSLLYRCDRSLPYADLTVNLEGAP